MTPCTIIYDAVPFWSRARLISKYSQMGEELTLGLTEAALDYCTELHFLPVTNAVVTTHAKRWADHATVSLANHLEKLAYA